MLFDSLLIWCLLLYLIFIAYLCNFCHTAVSVLLTVFDVVTQYQYLAICVFLCSVKSYINIDYLQNAYLFALFVVIVDCLYFSQNWI